MWDVSVLKNVFVWGYVYKIEKVDRKNVLIIIVVFIIVLFKCVFSLEIRVCFIC